MLTDYRSRRTGIDWSEWTGSLVNLWHQPRRQDRRLESTQCDHQPDHYVGGWLDSCCENGRITLHRVHTVLPDLRDCWGRVWQ
jgi:hypothetical protein